MKSYKQSIHMGNLIDSMSFSWDSMIFRTCKIVLLHQLPSYLNKLERAFTEVGSLVSHIAINREKTQHNITC
jgi:hypothetical protein